MRDQKNLILAIVLSVAIILLFQVVIAPPQRPTAPQTTTQPATPSTPATAPGVPSTAPPGTPATPGTAPPGTTPPKAATRDEVLKASPRIAFDGKRISGSISLKGGLLDDVTLRDYRESVEKNSANVHLLNPAGLGKGGAYYVTFGWQLAQGAKPVALPDDNTVWQAAGGPLAPGKPLTLTWTNPQGLKFSRRFEIDENYLVTVQEMVENTGT